MGRRLAGRSERIQSKEVQEIMKQIHKLKERNRHLEEALKQIERGAREQSMSFSKIAELASDALDKKGNHK